MKHLCLTFVIMMIGLLAGCANTTASSDVLNIDDLNDSSLTPITPIYFNESNTDNVNQSDDKNAEITIPDSTEYAICTAESAGCDPEKVKVMLLGDTDISPERVGKNNAKYLWKKDGMELIVDPNTFDITFSGDVCEMIREVFSRPTRGQDGNIELFENINEELDFCTPKDAARTVREKLLGIGVNVNEKADVYAFHKDDLQHVIDRECAEGVFYDPHSMFNESGPTPLKSYEVKKSDECYYIVFQAEYTGIPIYDGIVSYKTIKDVVVFHPTICAVFSEDGIVGLEIKDYRGNITRSEDVKTIVTCERASEQVAAKYRDVVGVERIAFDTIELEYVIQPNYVNNKINLDKARMSPAWVCTISVDRYQANKETGVEELMSQKETVLIDALTVLNALNAMSINPIAKPFPISR